MAFIYFHGTDADYDAVDPTCLGMAKGGPANCRMGLWIARDRDLAEKFGCNVLEVAIPEDLIETMSIDTLSRMHREGMRDEDEGVERHVDYADAARERGSAAIFVQERDGTAPTGVVVDLRAVLIKKVDPATEFAI
jgi:hypothetical protein